MTATFTTIPMVNSRVLVKGTDKFGTEGQAVLDSTQWDEICAHSEYNQATEAFDKAVEEFFAPLTEAAEAASKAMTKPTDSISYVVLEESTEGVPAKSGHIVKLNTDSIVLRLLELNDYDRLVWVNDTLEVLQAEGEPVATDG